MILVGHASGSTHILGYTTSELIFLILASELITDIASMTTFTSQRLPFQILRGELDGFLIKPLPVLIAVGLQQFFIKSLVSFTFIAIVLIGTIVISNMSFSIQQIVAILFIFAQSIILLFCINFLAGILSFFVEGLMDIQNFILDMKTKISGYPRELFPTIFQNIFTFVIPILLIASPLLKVFHNTYSREDMILGLVISGFFVLLSTVLWSIGLRRYSSAN